MATSRCQRQRWHPAGGARILEITKIGVHGIRNFMILGCTLKKIARLASLAAGGAPNIVEYGTLLLTNIREREYSKANLPTPH